MKDNNEKKKLSQKRFLSVEFSDDNDLDDYVIDDIMSGGFGGLPSDSLETSGEDILKEDLQNQD